MIFYNKKHLFVIIIFLFFILIGCPYCYSQAEEGNYQKEFSILSGWMYGSLKNQDDYEMVPLYFQFGFDITPSFHSKRLPGNLNFILEPFLNTVVSPNNNIEAGNDFMLRYSYPVIQRLHIYVEGGAGMMYASQHTSEQSTQFNFNEQAGGGIYFFFSKNKAVNLGYRYRHFSNCDIKSPNKGVDMDGFLAGISILY